MLARPEQLYLAALEGALVNCRSAGVRRAPTGLAVEASTQKGFDVALLIMAGSYVLVFDQWEETFDDADYARDLFEAALVGDARLRIETIAGRRFRWTVERLDAAGHWVAESTTGRPVWRFWGKHDVEYLRNNYPRRATELG